MRSRLSKTRGFDALYGTVLRVTPSTVRDTHSRAPVPQSLGNTARESTRHYTTHYEVDEVQIDAQGMHATKDIMTWPVLVYNVLF